MKSFGVGETGVGEMGVGKMGQIIGETGIGEMGVGETGTNFKFTLYLSYMYLVIGVKIWGIVFMVILKLPGAITDNRQRIKAVNCVPLKVN